MSLEKLSTTTFLAACAAAAAVALAPAATALAPDGCEAKGTTTTCEQPGHASISVAPGADNGGTDGRSGMYGQLGEDAPAG